MVNSPSELLYTLGQYLAGEFENRLQALQDPTWYVHLKLWSRPVQLFQADSLTFFMEQLTVAVGTPPYRQRILRLQMIDGQLTGRYYGLKDPLQFRGGGLDPDLFLKLSTEDLVDFPTCQITFIPTPQPTGGYHFKAAMAPDTLCRFEYNNNVSHVRLNLEVSPPTPPNNPAVELLLQDQGIDPDTGKVVWGPMMGPLRLVKQQTYS